MQEGGVLEALGRVAARMFDRVRIDYFRGFAAHWRSPATPRPRSAVGSSPFAAPCSRGCASIPGTAEARFIAAEDLGVITEDAKCVHFAFPGIQRLQFSFWRMITSGRPAVGVPQEHGGLHLHARQPRDHGWCRGETDGTRTAAQAQRERDKIHDYLGHNPTPDYAHFALIRLALATVADTVITPVQDVLGLGNAARMNTPGIPEGTSTASCRGSSDNGWLDHLRHITKLYGRIPTVSVKV